MLFLLLFFGVLGISLGNRCDDFLSSDQKLKIKLEETDGNQNKYLLIKCNFENDEDFASLVPNCTYPSVNIVRFQECSFSNRSIATTLDVIGAVPERLVTLTLANPHGILEISSSFLERLVKLTDFLLFSGNVAKVRRRSFINSPNLKMLLLSGNRFSFLPEDSFYGLPKLKVLSLENNRLNYLSDDLLSGLPELENIIVINNNLTSLSPRAFSNLPRLKSISLHRNNLQDVDPYTFANNTLLELINMRKNKLDEIPIDLFSNLTRLKKLVLAHNNISVISAGTFASLEKLTELDLSGNVLEFLEEDSFQGLTNISELDLSKNRLKTFDSGLLQNSPELLHLNLGSNFLSQLDPIFLQTLHKTEHLDLSDNLLSSIGGSMFQKCRSLKNLILKYNKISNVRDSNSFPRSLEHIDLSHNLLAELEAELDRSFIFSNNINLISLDVSHNNLSYFPDVWTLLKLKTFNLKNNKITSLSLLSINHFSDGCFIDLSENEIYSVNFYSYMTLSTKITLDISGNPFMCDCKLLPFVRSVRDPKAFPTLTIKNSPQTQCQNPFPLNDTRLDQVHLEDLTCAILAPNKLCSQICDCIVHEQINLISVDCSNRSLTSVPPIHHRKRYTYSYDLSYNELQKFNFSEEMNNTLLKLDLSHNHLTDEIISNLSYLPTSLEMMDLSYNAFQHLPLEFLNFVNRTNLHIDFSGTQWVCDCELNFLHDHVQASFKKLVNVRNIKCKGYSKPLIDMRNEEVCYSAAYWTLITGGPIIAFTVAIIVTVLFIHYKMAILVWMYSHQLCLGIITEEEVDSDKIYDAFISYAHEDEDFVRNELLSKLENQDPKYKICIHWRDWIGGELIQTQILKSVKTSRRIIVVLSENFVRSSWGQDEFRSAHQQALEDKTNRVILVVYGKVPPNEMLEDELRHYIRSHTYIKWGNPKFWDQLNFAMPHRKQFPKKKERKQETIKMDPV